MVLSRLPLSSEKFLASSGEDDADLLPPDEIEVDEIVRSASSREFEEEATPKPALSFTPDC